MNTFLKKVQVGYSLFECNIRMLQLPASDPAVGWGRGGGDKKHEIYVAAFYSHLFYDLFLQGWGDGGMAPLDPPPDPLLAAMQDDRLLALGHLVHCKFY